MFTCKVIGVIFCPNLEAQLQTFQLVILLFRSQQSHKWQVISFRGGKSCRKKAEWEIPIPDLLLYNQRLHRSAEKKQTVMNSDVLLQKAGPVLASVLNSCTLNQTAVQFHCSLLQRTGQYNGTEQLRQCRSGRENSET